MTGHHGAIPGLWPCVAQASEPEAFPAVPVHLQLPRLLAPPLHSTAKTWPFHTASSNILALNDAEIFFKRTFSLMSQMDN